MHMPVGKGAVPLGDRTRQAPSVELYAIADKSLPHSPPHHAAYLIVCCNKRQLPAAPHHPLLRPPSISSRCADIEVSHAPPIAGRCAETAVCHNRQGLLKGVCQHTRKCLRWPLHMTGMASSDTWSHVEAVIHGVRNDGVASRSTRRVAGGGNLLHPIVADCTMCFITLFAPKSSKGLRSRRKLLAQGLCVYAPTPSLTAVSMYFRHSLQG
jgi:hypothetical protein